MTELVGQGLYTPGRNEAEIAELTAMWQLCRARRTVRMELESRAAYDADAKPIQFSTDE